MTNTLDNLIRSWGEAGEGVPPRRPPTEACLTMARARQLAAGEGASPADEEHAQSCEFCQRLVLDFREALADARAAGAAGEEDAPAKAGAAWRRPVRILAGLAAAAAILVGIHLLLRPVAPGGGPADGTRGELALADVRVGLPGQIDAGLTPKAVPEFVSGDVIVLTARLTGAGHVALIHRDGQGVVSALPPDPDRPDLQVAADGNVRLGPYLLDQSPGLETFFVAASREPIRDLPAKVASLQALARADANLPALSAAIRQWPAAVEMRTIRHRSAPATSPLPSPTR